VVTCSVVVDERFNADLGGSLSEVVESSLHNCKSCVANVSLFKILSVTYELTLRTDTSSP